MQALSKLPKLGITRLRPATKLQLIRPSTALNSNTWPYFSIKLINNQGEGFRLYEFTADSMINKTKVNRDTFANESLVTEVVIGCEAHSLRLMAKRPNFHRAQINNNITLLKLHAEMSFKTYIRNLYYETGTVKADYQKGYEIIHATDLHAPRNYEFECESQSPKGARQTVWRHVTSDALQLGLLAPNSEVQQPVHVYVVTARAVSPDTDPLRTSASLRTLYTHCGKHDWSQGVGCCSDDYYFMILAMQPGHNLVPTWYNLVTGQRQCRYWRQSPNDTREPVCTTFEMETETS